MSYDEFETSVSSGRPYYLYAFNDGTTTTRLTSNADDLLKMTETWTASPLSHADIEQTGNIEKSSLQLTFPLSDSYARQFLQPVPQVVTATIWRGHLLDEDEEHRVVWKGRVVGAKTQNQILTLEIESVFTSLRRPGCRARYQRTCRFALYHVGCNLDITAFQTEKALTEISGLVLTVPAAGSETDGYYKAGVLEYNGLFGFIVDHSGSSLTLLAPVQGLQEALDAASGSLTVKLAPGCDLSRTMCEEKFSNELNHGGFPYMPDKNPFSVSIF